MSGLIPHLVIGLIAAFIVHMVHFKLEYSLAVFIGNLLPDIITFGGSAVKQLTISIFTVEHDAFYKFLSVTTLNPVNWFGLGFFIFAVSLFLYHYHYIQKKTMEEYDELYLFLLGGILIHILVDILILEHGPWV